MNSSSEREQAVMAQQYFYHFPQAHLLHRDSSRSLSRLNISIEIFIESIQQWNVGHCVPNIGLIVAFWETKRSRDPMI